MVIVGGAALTAEHTDLIVNGSLVNSDLSLTPTILPPTSLTLHLVTPNTSQPLYAAVSVWSLDLGVAPSGCATPSQTPLVPGADTGQTIRHLKDALTTCSVCT